MIEEIERNQPIARKEHRCDFCRGIIKKGEKYDNATLKYDGSLYRWKSHLHCLELASTVAAEYDEGDGITADSFEEAIWNYVCKYHYDEEEWENNTIPELAKMIYEEIRNK